jgi:hypothetical protein
MGKKRITNLAEKHFGRTDGILTVMQCLDF